MVRRVVWVAVLIGLTVFVYAYTSGARSEGIKREFLKVADLVDVSGSERNQICAWIEECHPDIYARVSAMKSDTPFDGPAYAKRMFDELVSRAQRDGKSALAELLEQLAGEVNFDVMRQ